MTLRSAESLLDAAAIVDRHLVAQQRPRATARDNRPNLVLLRKDIRVSPKAGFPAMFAGRSFSCRERWPA
jgi:hypothetical protein